MPQPVPRYSALIQHLDHLIEKHGQENQELASDLLAFKAQLQAAEKRRDARVYSTLAVQIAKFLYDHWPG